jgi:hypothetical protein
VSLISFHVTKQKQLVKMQFKVFNDKLEKQLVVRCQDDFSKLGRVQQFGLVQHVGLEQQFERVQQVCLEQQVGLVQQVDMVQHVDVVQPAVWTCAPMAICCCSTSDMITVFCL